MDWEEKWEYKDAEWYQFWLPQSGAAGGVIMGVVIVVLVALSVWALGE